MHTVPGAFEELTRLYAEGERAVEEGRFADAVATFTQGIAIDDHFRQRYVTMYAQRAFARHRMGDLAGAIEDYTRAIPMEPEPNQAQYHFYRGMCLGTLGGHDDEVLADYERSIALYPDHPGPYHLRGKLLVNLGRWPEAIADLDRLVAMNGHPEGHQLRGYAYLMLGRGDLAAPDIDIAAERAPGAWTSYLMAWAAALTGDDERFYRGLEEALRAEPSYKPYFMDNAEFAPWRGEKRFQEIVDAVGVG